MSTTTALPRITRPNGTVYRPRKLRTQLLGNEDEMTGIVVFGTADQRDARALAEADTRTMNAEYDYTDPAYAVAETLGQPVWWSRELSHFEDNAPIYHYRQDEERGAFGLLFDLVEAEPQDETRDGGSPARPYDTPLWGDEVARRR